MRSLTAQSTFVALALCTCVLASEGYAYPPQQTHEGDAPAGHALRVPPIDKEPFRVLQDAEYVEGEVYVCFVPDTPADLEDAAHTAAGAQTILWASEAIPGLYKVRVPVRAEPTAINAYLDQPEVLYAEPNYIWDCSTEPNDPRWDELWGMQNAKMDWAWDEWQGGEYFNIAIIDSGIVYTHSDLSANIWTNSGEIPGNGIDDDGNGYIDDYYGWDFGENDNDPLDTVGECGSHGTHVAGTVGAVGNNSEGVAGVNWRCKLVAIKVGFRRWDADEEVWKCGVASGPESVEYAFLKAGCKVSNNSYGGGAYSQTMYNMIEAAQAYGHIFVAAAGNGGDDGVGDNNDATPYYPSGYDLPNIIAVAAIDENDNLAGFSNYGLTAVDLGAPGVEILSTVNTSDYATKQGTSMAAPHVTGATGLIMSRFPNLSWQHTKTRILNAARPVNDLQGKCVSGGVLHTSFALSVWVDVYDGGLDLGTFLSPYQQFSNGYSSTPVDGLLRIKAGIVPVGSAPLNKRMIIQSYGGTATLVR